MSDSYYELVDAADPAGERFRATDFVISTWSSAIQHGAPVSALLVRALEGCAPREDSRLSRVVIDLLGPVPVGTDIWVRADVERPGKQIELIGAQMLAPGPDGQPRVVAKASGWRLQQTDTYDVVHTPAPPLRPLAEATNQMATGHWDRNYVHSVDWRWLTAPLGLGPGEAWITPVVDLVQGEHMTPLQRLFCVADDANGVGARLDISAWTFLNTDLAVHIYRIPDGAWIGVRAEASYGPDGIGTTVGTLFDAHGPVGAIQQSVLLRRRG